uniref:Carboxypeptidase n=1 Tax=Mucochytrium quahogii TaxID=96639 RepID=A0A7S2RMX7_9STRA
MDRVYQLPGWDRELPSKMYAGFLDGGSKVEQGQEFHMKYHYVFMESENDPENDPVLLWTNGGPGSSSLFGFTTEVGPFQLSSDSMKTESFKRTGVPTLFRNNYTWTKRANLLIMSGPAPVSFSYCYPAGQSGSGADCGYWNDTTTARANFHFLESFFKRFSRFQDNELYLSGESYAGVYILTLVREILNHKDSFTRKAIRGMAVGDGCMGNKLACHDEGTEVPPMFNRAKADFLCGHGQGSARLCRKIPYACPHNATHESAHCKLLVAELLAQVTEGYSHYDLYDECYWKDEDNMDTKPYPCGGDEALKAWVDRPEVRDALHVAQDNLFVNGDGTGLRYHQSEENVTQIYIDLLDTPNFRTLVYNGDVDASENGFVQQYWIEDLREAGFFEWEVDQQTSEWKAWTLDGKKKVVGYVSRYKGDFSFLSIRGAGHMVPLTKPKAALEMITRFLKNERWASYNP